MMGAGGVGLATARDDSWDYLGAALMVGAGFLTLIVGGVLGGAFGSATGEKEYVVAYEAPVTQYLEADPGR